MPATPSLRELLFIAQDRLHVEVLRRIEGGPWILSEPDGMQGAIELTSIGYTLRLADLYESAIAHDDTGVFQTVAG